MEQKLCKTGSMLKGGALKEENSEKRQESSKAVGVERTLELQSLLMFLWGMKHSARIHLTSEIYSQCIWRPFLFGIY